MDGAAGAEVTRYSDAQAEDISMTAIKLLAETAETVTISRSDFDSLIESAENAEDIASVRAWNAYVAAVGRDAAIANTYTDVEAKPCLTARARFGFGVRSAA
jgi:hypothetical protein